MCVGVCVCVCARARARARGSPSRDWMQGLAEEDLKFRIWLKKRLDLGFGLTCYENEGQRNLEKQHGAHEEWIEHLR